MAVNSRASGAALADSGRASIFEPVPAGRLTGVASGILAKVRLTGVLERWNARQGGVVLAFHEISAARLAQQLEVVAEKYRFVSLRELVDRLAAGQSTCGLAAITFDDGIGSVSEDAAALALKRGWPMTFYLPTAALDRGEAAWYHELPALLHAARGRTIHIAGTELVLDSAAAIHDAIAALTVRFRDCAEPDAVAKLLSSVRAEAGTSADLETTLAVFAPLSWPRVRELAQHQELSFEAHSVSHLAMSQLTADRVATEMAHSRLRIEEATGKPVHHFCYPYGGFHQIGTIAAALARRMFRSAVTMARGRCTARADLALLPRVPLYQTDTADAVALKIALAR